MPFARQAVCFWRASGRARSNATQRRRGSAGSLTERVSVFRWFSGEDLSLGWSREAQNKTHVFVFFFFLGGVPKLGSLSVAAKGRVVHEGQAFPPTYYSK